MKKGRIKILALTGVVISTLLTGCAGAYNGSATATDMFATESEDQYSNYESSQVSESQIEQVEAKENVADSRKLIKTVSMDVETNVYDELLPNVEAKIIELGGYIENASTYNGSYYDGYKENRTSNIKARIPKNRLSEFVTLLEEKSNVTNKSQTTEDVTLRYVDMDAHKKMLQLEQSRLLELLEKAETIEDIITIESRLSEVRYQIESMESQLRTYDNLVDYSTVNLTITEVKIYTQPKELGSLEKIRLGFAENVYHVKEGLKNFGIGFIIRIPYMVIWAGVIFIFLFIIKVIRGIVRKRRNKETFVKTEIVSENSSEKKENE